MYTNLFCRFVHHEQQPHKFAASWTTFRDPYIEGSHFYNASYGIRVQSSHNYASFWQPSDLHGTSLANVPYSEKGERLVQCGLALVTAARLPSAWKQFMAERGSGGKVKEIMEKVLEEDDK